MSNTIQLIAGLCNPGAQYDNTRHNAGAWFVSQFADAYQAEFTLEKKFNGLISKITIAEHPIILLLPTTFMNLSGQSITAVLNYFKITPQSMLIAHDDIDLEPGIARIKFDGGHAGHNGIRNIIQQLGDNKQFYRLRLGVGHPGRKELVHDYVLKSPNKIDQEKIQTAITQTLHLIPDFITGNKDEAIKTLHTLT